MSEVTELLIAMSHGDTAASARLLPLVYDELRLLARAHMAGERAEHTLQATALVHEAYLRLIGHSQPQFNGRCHFFGAAAEAMRRILVDYARAKNAQKRGGQSQRMDFSAEALQIQAPCREVDDILALDEALNGLGVEHPAEANTVKLVYFAGLSLAEAAQVQGISRSTARRYWHFARAWLLDAMSEKSSKSVASQD